MKKFLFIHSSSLPLSLSRMILLLLFTFLSLLFLSPIGIVSASSPWSVVDSPNVVGANGAFAGNLIKGISGVSSSSVFAVGTAEDSNSGYWQTVIMHSDGSTWTLEQSTNPSSVYNALNGVAAISTDEAFAVGVQSTNGEALPLIEHYSKDSNGVLHWTTIPASSLPSPIPPSGETLTGRYLSGITAPSANNLFVVGFYDTIDLVHGGGYTHALVYHFDGSTWSIVPSDIQQGEEIGQLNGVTSLSSNDIWTVGYELAFNLFGQQQYKTLIKECRTQSNTFTCVTVPSPNPTSNTHSISSPALSAVSASPQGDLWAVGGYTENDEGTFVTKTLFMHKDVKNGWYLTSPLPPLATTGVLTTIVAIAPNNLWAAGDKIWHYDGDSWTVSPLPDNTTTTSNGTTTSQKQINSLTAVTPNNLWGGGYYGLATGGGGNLTINTTTQSPPIPFLELPFGGDFNTVATAINTYFDHTYPLLGSGFAEPSDFSHQLTRYAGDSGNFFYSSHNGYDYGIPANVKFGDPVLAAGEGTATLVTSCGECGNMIQIDHGNGYQTKYMHMQATGLITTAGNSVHVNAGDPIGKVGDTGNCYVIDGNGNKIYNTPSCAHLHFGVYYDKQQNGTFTFDDVTDPYGWEPGKSVKDPDPWENCCSFTSSFTGVKSYYLFKHPLGLAPATYPTATGVNLSLGNNDFVFPSGLSTDDLVLQMLMTPSVQIASSGGILRSLGASTTVNAFDPSGGSVTSLLSSYTLTTHFTQSDLYNMDPSSLSLYSSEDGVTWKREDTTLDFTTDTASAQINHFSEFTLMGQVLDTIPPTTTASLSGTLTQKANTYSTNVTITLSATDTASSSSSSPTPTPTGSQTASPSGIAFTTYKLDSSDWQPYTTPFTLSSNGKHTITYYSEDNGGNVESVQTITPDVEKPPVTTITLSSPNLDGTSPNPTTVTLSASASAGTTIKSIYYKIDSSSQKTYTTPFTIATNGKHTITYYSVDSNGNQEAQNSKTITIETVLLSDTFEQDSLGSLPSGWSVSSGTWTVASVSGSKVVQQTDTATTSAKELINGNTSWTDYTVRADLILQSITKRVALTGRRTDGNNNYELRIGDTNKWSMGKYRNGSYTTLTSGTLSTSLQTNTPYTLSLTFKGSNITGKITQPNNTITPVNKTVTDTTFTTGNISLRTYNQATYDNVMVYQ